MQTEKLIMRDEYGIICGDVPAQDPDEKKQQAIDNCLEFLQANGSNLDEVKGILNKVKKICFGETQATSIQNARGISNQSKDSLIKPYRYIVQNIMGLTPAEYDAIFSTALNQACGLSYAERIIVENAPESIKQRAMFNQKAIFFLCVFPEYWEATHPDYKPGDVFFAKGDIKASLIRASKKNGKTVDKILYWSFSRVLPVFKFNTRDMFIVLANPVKAKFNHYPILNIYNKYRALCYPSLLDFYFLNSPIEFQREHVDEYMEVREMTGLPQVPILDAMFKNFDKYERAQMMAQYNRRQTSSEPAAKKNTNLKQYTSQKKEQATNEPDEAAKARQKKYEEFLKAHPKAAAEAAKRNAEYAKAEEAKKQQISAYIKKQKTAREAERKSKEVAMV